MESSHKIETTYSAAFSGQSYISKINPDEYNPRGSSVSNYACKEEPNIRYRAHMEDSSKLIDSYIGDPNQGYFAVFDGHGGSEAVDYCKARMHEELRKCIQDFPDDIPRAFTRCFQKVDDQLRLTGAVTSGTTATVSFLRKEGYQKVLYLANVGDSKAVLLTPNGAEQLSYDHKGTDQGEIDRILSEGGILMRGRVAGQLAVTRALGDHHLKTSGVSNVPHVVRRVVTPNDTCLVIASDGIWDTVDYNTLRANKGRSSLDIANELIQKALSSGSQDNICVIIVCF
jgi:serine/threonine protein phosphatase PrpC